MASRWTWPGPGRQGTSRCAARCTPAPVRRSPGASASAPRRPRATGSERTTTTTRALTHRTWGTSSLTAQAHACWPPPAAASRLGEQFSTVKLAGKAGLHPVMDSCTLARGPCAGVRVGPYPYLLHFCCAVCFTVEEKISNSPPYGGAAAAMGVRHPPLSLSDLITRKRELGWQRSGWRLHP